MGVEFPIFFFENGNNPRKGIEERKPCFKLHSLGDLDLKLLWLLIQK
jgi:hypothetical protein